MHRMSAIRVTSSLLLALVLLLGSCLERPDLAQSGWACATASDCAPGAACLSGVCFAADTTPCFQTVAPQCDDGLTCTADACDLTRNVCVHAQLPGTCMADGASCGCEALTDRSRCVVGVCDPVRGCVERPQPAGTQCGGSLSCASEAFMGRLCDGQVEGCGAPGPHACPAQADERSVGMCLEDSGCAFLPAPGESALLGHWLQFGWSLKTGGNSAARTRPEEVEFLPDGVARLTIFNGSGTESIVFDHYAITPEGRLTFTAFDKRPPQADIDGTFRFAVAPVVGNWRRPDSTLLVRRSPASLTASHFEGRWRGFMTRAVFGEGGTMETSALMIDIDSTGRVTRAVRTAPGDTATVVEEYLAGGAVDAGLWGRWALTLITPDQSAMTLIGWLDQDGKLMVATLTAYGQVVGMALLLDAAAAAGPASVDGLYTISGTGPPRVGSEEAYARPFSFTSYLDATSGVGRISTDDHEVAPLCEELAAVVSVQAEQRTVEVEWTRAGWRERLTGWYLPGSPIAPRIPFAVLAPAEPAIPADGSVAVGAVFDAGLSVMAWTPLRARPECPLAVARR